MIYPKTELRKISDIVGYGVVATQFIPAGTITWVHDKFDRSFTPFEFENMDPVYQNILDIYSYRDSKGNYILCWDNGRFVNHSFKSNCMTTAYGFEIAIRDIAIGEELTDDYGYLNISEPFEGVDEGTDRKIVYPDDLVTYHEVWDKQLQNVFHKITELNQPMKNLISVELWKKIEAITDKKIEMDSILTNYFDQRKIVGR